MSSFDPTDYTNTTPEPAPKQVHPLTEIIQFAVIALIIVIPIRMFVAQPFIVSGASMEDTFQSGEYLIVDQVSYRFEEPGRGDVVIFRYPKDTTKYFIKRIIGVPGDTVDITGNTVTVTNKNGSSILPEPYVKSMEENTQLTETLTDGEYFVMGDNRDQSSDSRVWGILTRDKIVGRALVRLFPINEVGLHPGEYEIVLPTNQE